MTMTEPTVSNESGAQIEPVLETRDVFTVDGLNVFYGDHHAVSEVDLSVKEREITAFIGPSGCGKSTVLRCFNRMNDLIDIARVEGTVRYHGVDLYDEAVDPVAVRRRIGMVFQKPNPFPKSIYDNVAYGPRVGGQKGNLDEVVERSLRSAGLWDEVKDRLGESALGMSGGQQQRLCIARAIAVNPDVLLMDEPCSALDPKATEAVEELIWELRGRYSILIVTHNMAQARRASEECVFMLLGKVIEHGATEDLFLSPEHQETADYIEGRYG